ncbi:MAG: Gfo/Idh/MocA family oxidoreductase [Acidimicrobiaceae bacterium]|nr:Gfo/Idh/MocA family oxidoreductase [Acidimicrobiaceae bacterium]
MNFGLVGTGYWAWVTQAPGLARLEGAHLSTVWGRNPDRTADLAAEFGARPAGSYAELLEKVDAVVFGVPPDVQAELAVEAAGAGRHLLLEKPMATSLAAADGLVGAVDAAGVSSVVFFTSRYDPGRQAWLEDVVGETWNGAWARSFAANFVEGSPYASSTWRWERGALWDLGPHVLSVLLPVLGHVEAVSARPGVGDLAHLVLTHAGGATSTASITLRASRRAAGSEVAFWGERGIFSMPPMAGTSKDAFVEAARELMEGATAGRRSHPCDVHFGREVVRILAEAEAQLDPAGGPG